MPATVQPQPRATAAWGIALFVLSLAILFASSMLAYFVIRIQNTSPAENRPVAVPLGSLRSQMPGLLWLSTTVIIASSFTIGRALSAVKLERQKKLRSGLYWTAVLAVLFVFLQIPALGSLLKTHFTQGDTGNHLYGVLFALILLHALHVLGGLIFLGIVIYGASKLRYDHEHYVGVRNLTVYWHFLDVVWLLMFFSLYGIG